MLEVDVYGTSVLVLMASEPHLFSEMPDIFFSSTPADKSGWRSLSIPKTNSLAILLWHLPELSGEGLWLSEKHGTRLKSVKNPF